MGERESHRGFEVFVERGEGTEGRGGGEGSHAVADAAAAAADAAAVWADCNVWGIVRQERYPEPALRAHGSTWQYHQLVRRSLGCV